MKCGRFFSVIFIWILILLNFFQASAGSFFTTDTARISYCQWGECSFERWVSLLRNGLNDIVTNRKFSVYIQDVVIYLLTFVTILGVIFIIYAGFQLMTSWGDEEKYKKTKNIIVYVILWIILMWLAYPIMRWIITLLNFA